MSNSLFLEITISVAAAVILFVYALRGFGEDVRRVGGEDLSRVLARLTTNPMSAFFLGVIVTALVQSSSAVAGITVALVQAGTITFRGSLPVFLGANVGTTSTAWLMSINTEILGPTLVVMSAILSILPGRISLFGRSIFYLGVVLLALRLISEHVAPLKEIPEFASWLVLASHPVVGLLVGIVATALLQSSSVIVGVAVIAVQQEFLLATDVVPIILGANIGTTSTALLASLELGSVARRAAIANLLFNVIGVLLFLPVIGVFSDLVVNLTGGGATAVAVTHLIFNIGVAVIGFILVGPMTRLLKPKALGIEPIGHKP